MEWVDKFSREFGAPKEVTQYNHWETGDDNINFDIELGKISQLPTDNDYIVIAKSTGCILALMLVKEGILNIEELFFIGFPMFYIKNRNIDIGKLLVNKIPTTFIQKEKDFQIGFNDLKNEISIIKPASKFILYHRESEPDDNHHYGDTQYLKEIITTV